LFVSLLWWVGVLICQLDDQPSTSVVLALLHGHVRAKKGRAWMADVAARSSLAVRIKWGLLPVVHPSTVAAARTGLAHKVLNLAHGAVMPSAGQPVQVADARAGLAAALARTRLAAG
jgi:hypothetical protein